MLLPKPIRNGNRVHRGKRTAAWRTRNSENHRNRGEKMAVSVFDIFKIGIGPSSSHTVGPMRAALMFAHHLRDEHTLTETHEIRISLYGSLGATGKGHGTDKGVILGLMGHAPDSINPDLIADLIEAMRKTASLRLLNVHTVRFVEKEHILFYRREAMAEHPNGMKFEAFDLNKQLIASKSYLSVGGGFVVTAGASNAQVLAAANQLPYAFTSGDELLKVCAEHKMSVAQIMWENEKSWRSAEEIRSQLLHIWAVMQACVKRGCHATDIMPGPLQVRRRAPALYQQLSKHAERGLADPLSVLDWINLYAMAVNEENACGGRVVTARPMAPLASCRRCCTITSVFSQVPVKMA